MIQAADRKPDVPVFRLTLRPTPQCTDPIRALRWALKSLLRQHRFRCLSVEEVRE